MKSGHEYFFKKMAYLSYIKAFDCRTCINKGKKKKCIVRKGGRGGWGGGVNLKRGVDVEMGGLPLFDYFTVQSHLLCVGGNKVPFINFQIFSILS